MSNAKITPTFNELIDLTLYPESMGSYEVDIPLNIEGVTWTAYEANLAFREEEGETMTLQSIREAKTFEDLKPAIRFLCDKMQKMTWGEFTAYKRTLEDQAIKVGSTIKDLNEYAEQYQVFGHEENNDKR